jgi:Domain of unknown function (DUF4365)
MDHGAVEDQKEGRLTEETDESFSYLCRQEDLEYWLGSNVPVVLFVARLSDERIFWKALDTWFADADHRRTRKVVFDKLKDALNEARLSQRACGRSGPPGMSAKCPVLAGEG